ncbi:MAG: lipopolysaccharide kinase InaA family protein [Gemmatimonadaceae bacterium]
MTQRVPEGYTRLRVGDAEAVARDDAAAGVREVLGRGTLYDFGTTHPERRELAGRRPAYAIPLPSGGPRVVVRRSQHGGLLAALTRDLFFPPTRAPYELLVSLILARAGVPTPPVIAYAVYPVGPLFRRSDVATAEVRGEDLRSVLGSAPNEPASAGWLTPVSELLKGLARAGAWHPDLNIKNILLAPDDAGATRAYVLDVDRISFHPPEDPNVRSANFQRLERSLRKWSEQGAIAVDARVVGRLRELAFST